MKSLSPEQQKKSQSVPRDGGYCNRHARGGRQGVRRVSIRPEGRGVLQPSQRAHEAAMATSQSVPRDGGYCNTRS